MRANIPAPLARTWKTEDKLDTYDDTGVVCLVAPFEFTSPDAPEHTFRENILYAGRVLLLEVAKARSSMLRHWGIQSFVARPTASGAWFYLPHARRMKDEPPGYTEFFMVKQPGPVSRGRALAPQALTLTEAMGFCDYDTARDRLGNRWFLRHLRREAAPVPCPPGFTF